MDRETELGLVERLRAGDPDAFEAVHAACHVRLFNFLARLSRSRDVAEDLLEETWLRLVAHASRLDPDTRLVPWLFAVARNLFYSHCRARAVEDGLDPSALGLWPSGTPMPSPFEAAAAEELERRVERAIAALPPPAREVLLLVGVEGLTPSDAARVCGISADALRQRLSRARAQLASELRREETCAGAQLTEVTT